MHSKISKFFLFLNLQIGKKESEKEGRPQQPQVLTKDRHFPTFTPSQRTLNSTSRTTQPERAIHLQVTVTHRLSQMTI